MNKNFAKMNSHSKKGTTLVELVVAMTLTLIFAVVCVALINPIERIYTQTSKMASAQLLADTVIDAIRDECDEVDYNDIYSVWIADVTVADENTDDSQLFNGPSGLKNTSGPVLVIKRNDGYCEAIYECLSVSEADRTKVHNFADENGVDPDTTAFAVDKLLEGGAEGAAQGIVHFGYYKSASDSSDGYYPYKSYDYTNPISASTYGKFTVKLMFGQIQNTKDKDGNEIPAYVECMVSILEDGKIVYSRNTAICFAPAGSAPGSGIAGGHGSGGSQTTKKDIEVRVLWDDQDNKDGLRPDEVKVNLTLNGSSTQSVIIHKDSNDEFSYTFANLDVDPTDPGAIVVTQDPVTGYKTLPTEVSGDIYTITNRRKEDTAKLVNGQTFNSLIGTDVDYVYFGSKDMITDEATKAIFEAATGPTKIAIPIDSNDSSAGKRIDDYVLYKYTNSAGEITAYILSEDGYFVANENCYRMFINCSKLKGITDITHINTERTTTMQEMFANCYCLKALELPSFVTPTCTNLNRMFSNCYSLYYLDLSGWQTQNVTTMIKMFQEVNSTITSKAGVTYTPDQPMAVLDISMFDFSSCTDVSYMFGYASFDPWTNLPTARGIQKIILPVAPNFSTTTNIKMEFMFAENYGLQTIENIESLGTARASSCQNMFKDCRSLTVVNIPFAADMPSVSAENMFDGCSSMTTVSLGNWNMSKNKNCKNMFRNCSALTSVSIPIQASSPCENAESMFEGCLSMSSVNLGNWNMSKNKTCKNMFKNCSSLTSVSIPMQTATLCSTTESMFEGCTSLTSVSLGTWKMAANTTMLKMFKNCSSLTDIMNFGNLTLSNVKNINELYYGCSSLGKNTESVTFSPNFSSCTSANFVFYGCSSLKEVNMNDAKFGSCTQAKQFFYGCTSLTKVHMEKVHFDACTDLSNMFQNCSSLTHIYMSQIHLNKVTNLSFLKVNSLKYLDISKAQLDGVTSLKELFKSKTALVEVDFSGVELPKCTTCESMFYGCTGLTTVNMKNFKTTLSDGTGISYKLMFYGCTGLTSLVDMTGWETSYVSDISFMFKNCTGLTTVKTEFNFPRIKYVDGVFASCTGLTSVDLSKSSFGTSSSDTYTVKDLFSGCSKLTSANLNDAVFENCVTFQSVFNNCNAMTEVHMERIDLEDCTAFTTIFNNCTSLTHIYMSGAYLNKLESMSNVIPTNAEYLDFSSAKLHSISTLNKAFESRKFTYVDFTDTELNICTSYEYMFYNCTSLETVKWSPVTTITEPSISCEGMFKNCSSVASFDLGTWDSSNVISMNNMFSGCTSVLSFDFSGSLNSSNVTDMSYMFYNCSNTTSFDLTGLVTSNVTMMKGMFYGCYSVTSVDLSTWDTSKVTDMSEMFRDCYCLTQFNTSTWTGWDTSEVTTMTYMFYNCCYNGNTDQVIGTEDKYINISNFSFAKVTDTSFMFACYRKDKQDKKDTKDLLDTVYLPSAANGGDPLAYELIDARKMFDSREHLSSIENLVEFTNDDSLIYARAMFARVNCTELNIYNLDFSSLNTSMDSSAYIFDNCTVLVTIYVKPGTDYSKIFYNKQFNNDNCIVGEAGYTYHGEDRTYARVDGLDGNNGYFTEWTGT